MNLETKRQKLGTYVFFAFTLIPGMIVSGFMPDWNVLSFEAWIAIAAAGGAAGGYLWAEDQRWNVGLLSGAVAGAGTVAALFFYVLFRVEWSSTFWSIELVIPAMIGLLPGWILYRVLREEKRAAEVFTAPE